MPAQPVIGIMLYCPAGVSKNVFNEEKYRDLAGEFVESGMAVETIPYDDSRADTYRVELKRLDALLVWVNPVEQGKDRTTLDSLLGELADGGVFVSSLPETIQKIGTKKVLFDTRNAEFGSQVEIYSTYDEFRSRFPGSLKVGKTRVLKRFRGNGGDGVFKVSLGDNPDQIRILHAKRGAVEERKRIKEFYEDLRPYFDAGSPLLDQAWNDNITNGMVRCYMSRKNVAGFGYQEINALFPLQSGPVTPGRRFYFTEACALFADLRDLMEARWIDEIIRSTGLAADKLPVIWDADFFINSMVPNSSRRYTLCEINVSSVSPFPESAVRSIVAEVRNALTDRTVGRDS